MRRGLAIIAAGLLALSVAPAASAHETSRFRACTVHHVPGSCFTIGAAFVYGNRVKVRAVAEPVHAGYEARVQRRDPHFETWKPAPSPCHPPARRQEGVAPPTVSKS